MKPKRLLSPKEAAQELGVSVKSLQHWDKAGKLRVVRTPGNQRRIPIEEVARLRAARHEEARRCVLYARVSSVRQEHDGNLARQLARLEEEAEARGYQVVQSIAEQASSLNERRKGVQKLLALVEQQAIDVVLLEYPDRLVRFGFGYLEQAFGWKGVRVEVLEPPEGQGPTEELVQDLLTIVTVFAGRLYGHRAKSVRKQVELALKAGEGPNGPGDPHH
jgi:putative resolvase